MLSIGPTDLLKLKKIGRSNNAAIVYELFINRNHTISLNTCHPKKKKEKPNTMFANYIPAKAILF